jgi:SAM-dependent methyltransferase
MRPPTWPPARQAWQVLRAARRAVRRVTGWPAGPERFDAVLDTIARRGQSWLSEERPVATTLAPAGARAEWTATDAGTIDPRAWRWVVARDVAVDARRRTVRARLSWAEQGGAFSPACSLRVQADGQPRTYVVDLTRTRWRRARAVRALRFGPLDGPGTASIGALALVADLAQLEAADARWPLAKRYLRGRGIECGALQKPLRVRRGTRVVYVDRLTRPQARQHYPELAKMRLTSPHVVGEVERLPVGDRRLDFYIGNHLLEHARDALGGLEEMLRVVRPGGVVYVSIPDGGNPLDRHRAVTALAHHLADHEAGGDRSASDREHYVDYVTSAHAELAPVEREALTARYVAQGYSIHFHVFDEETFRALLGLACARAGAVVEEFARNPGPQFDEYVAILRRR